MHSHRAFGAAAFGRGGDAHDGVTGAVARRERDAHARALIGDFGEQFAVIVAAVAEPLDAIVRARIEVRFDRAVVRTDATVALGGVRGAEASVAGLARTGASRRSALPCRLIRHRRYAGVAHDALNR
jgi:hypothetical protein